MSRGPGRIERAIRALFDAHPDEAFTTDDICVECYPALRECATERKHRVAVVRAAEKIIATDPDWRSTWSWERGNMLVFRNMASAPSVAMARVLRFYPSSPRQFVVEKTRERMTPSETNKHGKEELDKIRREVSEHVALRDADPVERERLKAQQLAEATKRTQEAVRALQAMGMGRPQVLPRGNCDNRETLNALAAKARDLITQNDPDAIRAGLAEIADALDAISKPAECATVTA